jgi:hypothetical protein
MLRVCWTHSLQNLKNKTNENIKVMVNSTQVERRTHHSSI